MNKKILSMLCMMTALGTVNVNAAAQQASRSAALHSLSGVSLSVGVGMGFAHQTGFENSTEAIPDVVTYPVTKEKPTENTFAKFSPSYKQALAATVTPIGTPTVWNVTGSYVNIPGCFITDSKDANPYLPTPLPSVVTVTVDGDKIADTSLVSLNTNATYKKVDTITPFIDYSQINSLNGSIGVDVKGGVGYKFYVNDGFYLHPAVNFGYYNAKSENAVDSSYQQASFYTKAVKAQYVFAQTDAIKNGATVSPNTTTTPEAATQTLYSIDPETSVTQGVGSSLKDALTFQNQWYWNFVTSFGYQLSEGVSVEATVGYQMTRCKLTIQESDGSFANLGATFDKGSANSTILNAIGLNDSKQFYSFGEDLTEAEDSTAKMISGLVLGFGVNFAIAKNLTMGVSVTNVFNMAREFEIDDVQIAPTANSTAKAVTAAAAAGTTGTTGTTAAAGTTAQSAAPSDPETTTFNAKMSQNQTGISVNLTYFIPMGSDCAPAA